MNDSGDDAEVEPLAGAATATADPPSTKRRRATTGCICCVATGLVLALWLTVLTIALLDLKSSCMVGVQCRAVRGLCGDHAGLAEVEVDLSIECASALSGAEISMAPGQPAVVELWDAATQGLAASVAVHLPNTATTLGNNNDNGVAVARVPVRAVMESSIAGERLLALWAEQYGRKQPIGPIVVKLGADSGALISVNLLGVPVSPAVPLSFFSDLETEQLLDFSDEADVSSGDETAADSAAVQTTVGIPVLAVQQNDAQEFELSAELEIGVSALPSPLPTLELPPLRFELRASTGGPTAAAAATSASLLISSEPALLVELGALSVTEAELAADRRSLQLVQGATLRVRDEGVPAAADLMQIAMMGGESSGLAVTITGARDGNQCSLERLLAQMSAEIDLSESSGRRHHRRRRQQQEEGGDQEEEEPGGEFDLHLSAVGLATSASNVGAVLTLCDHTGRSLSSVLGAGWPVFALEGWTEGEQTFGLQLAFAAAAAGASSSGGGGEVEVSAVRGSLASAIQLWWGRLFGLHTAPLEWRLSCPGAETTVLGQLAAAIRVADVFQAREAAAAAAAAAAAQSGDNMPPPPPQSSEEAVEEQDEQDEMDQIMGHFTQVEVATSTPSELSIDTTYALVLPQSLSDLLLDTSVEPSVYHDTSLQLSVVDVDSEGVALAAEPVRVIAARLVHATSASVSLEISAEEPDSIGRMIEQLAERKPTDFSLAIRADDGRSESDGGGGGGGGGSTFDTGEISLHVPRGWHYFRGEGSRVAVPCDGGGDGDGDDETTEGSLLGPITTETDWGLTSVDVSITTGLTNPLPISIAVTSFSFEIFHDDGDDELLATGGSAKNGLLASFLLDRFSFHAVVKQNLVSCRDRFPDRHNDKSSDKQETTVCACRLPLRDARAASPRHRRLYSPHHCPLLVGYHQRGCGTPPGRCFCVAVYR
jgi:hypothetical protein